MNYAQLEEIRDLCGDSFYLLDLKQFEKNYAEFLSAFQNKYKKTAIGYSYKTNYIPNICQIIHAKGGYAEVVSEMEYELANRLEIPANRIIVNGPYKPQKALQRFIFDGSIVNLDSYAEVSIIEKLASDHPQRKITIGLRCNFDIGNDVVSRFGFDTSSEQFFDMVAHINSLNNVEITGIHCHFPDRNADSYINRAERIIDLSRRLFKSPPKYIDIGGGYFGKMPKSLQNQFSSYHSYAEYADKIGNIFAAEFGSLSFAEQPELILEPGSALVADTMKFVSTIIDIKNIRGHDIATSSGSKFNIGLLSSTVSMPIDVFSVNDKAQYFENINISGFTCIESDYLYKGYTGKLAVGDFIVLNNVGSYSIVFKPPFILPNVPIIEINKSNLKLIKRQETADDIFSTYILTEE